VAHEGADAGGFPGGNLQYFFVDAQLETCATETASTEWATDASRFSAW